MSELTKISLENEPIALKVVNSDDSSSSHQWDIVIVGVGGTGGYLLQSLMRLLKNFEIEGQLTLVDGDYVEVKNLNRQNFILRDVGRRKVDVLASRYSNVYDIDIRTVEEYVESVKAVKHLFTLHYQTDQTHPKIVHRVLIGCVDNNKSRQVFHQFFEEEDNVIYIDAGNDGVLPVTNEVSVEDSKESGYSGQVVVGVKFLGKTILEPVGSVYPNILEEQPNDFFPSQVSCGQAVVSYPQRFQTNLLSANVVLGYLNTLLDDGTLISHYTNFNARNNLVRPAYITKADLPKKASA